MTARRRWLAQEVVQTSAMDCGPATLHCLLESHGIRASYGRLREACQTDIDGTSIDALEAVAGQLGLDVEQVLIPKDHALLAQAATLPAIAVVRLPGGATHFTVLWRRLGPWVQVMDPAVGRRWVHHETLSAQWLKHEVDVPVADWQAWAHSPDFTAPLRQRLQGLGVRGKAANALVARASAHHSWFGLGALDASVRFVQSVVRDGGLDAGVHSAKLVQALFEQTVHSPDDIYQRIPMAYWSVAPQASHAGEPMLRVCGVVLVRALGRTPTLTPAQDPAPPPQALPRELRAAQTEPPPQPLRAALALLRQGSRRAPAALLGVSLTAAAAVVMEMLLFRGLLDVSQLLGTPTQRLLAVVALLGFGLLVMGLEWSITREAMRLGRQLETRLRMAVMAHLPRLSERYFQSRAISDLAERSHSLHSARHVPGLVLQGARTVADLGMTLLGVAWIDPRCMAWALPMVTASVALPLLWRPWMGERDMRVRNQASALHSFSLDALLGLVPIRSHGAERAVRREHEGLLVGWAHASLDQARVGLWTEGLLSTLNVTLACALLWQHLARAGGVQGADLLLVYWVLKLPALGQWLVQLTQQLSAQRNVLARVMEPLHAPAEAVTAPLPTPANMGAHSSQSPHSTAQHATPSCTATSTSACTSATDTPSRGVRIEVMGGQVRAGGHTLLDGLDVHIAPGEHVAVVGASGAGKSTLAGLLLGLHRLSAGHWRVDGQAPCTQALRACTAWVDPAAQLWNRSLLDNLSSALPDAHMPDWTPVLATAQLRGVLQQLPQGLQSCLGEGGTLLSGGEGQRVRLARALAQSQVRLAVLDEPFRGLDRAQRQLLLREVRQWWSQATMLCVTHDVSETQAFDRVLVVEHGQIVEDGHPAQLARQPSRYRDMLQTEQGVHTRWWQHRHWRHLHLDHQGLHG